MENCNTCKFINITEEQQTDKKIDHMCMKHHVRVFHRSNNTKIEHDYLYPCKQCDVLDYERR